MKTVRLGATRLEVTPIGYGTWQSDGECGPVDERAVVNAIGQALVCDASPAWLRKDVEASLDALGTDYIDLYQVHWPDPGTPIVQPPFHLFGRGTGAGLLRYARAHDISVLVYGPLARGLLGYRRTLTAIGALRRFAADRGVSIARLAMAWLLAHPAIQVVFAGSRTPAQLRESAGAVDLALSQAELAEIDTIMAASVPLGGPAQEGMT